MKNKKVLPYLLCGIAAGTVNGLFGTGGGMILVTSSYFTECPEICQIDLRFAAAKRRKRRKT